MRIGVNLEGTTMKRTKKHKYEIDWKETNEIRTAMASQKFIKITINVDARSLASLKKEAEKTGMPYQRLLNAVLKEGIAKRTREESRLERLEREIAKMKKKLAA